VLEDSPCLKLFLYGKHELLASIDIFPCPKPCVQTQIHPVELEFLDPVVQCLINLLQSVITELVDLIEPHDHLNPIFIPKCDGPWRVNYCEVVLELKASGIPSRFEAPGVPDEPAGGGGGGDGQCDHGPLTSPELRTTFCDLYELGRN
ncbi:hypothetical protein Tco_1537609, partial [Tanacetum coccineum]